MYHMYQMLEMSRHDLYSLSSEHLAPQSGAPRASTAPAEPIKPFITIATIIASGLNRWTSGHIARTCPGSQCLSKCVCTNDWYPAPSTHTPNNCWKWAQAYSVDIYLLARPLLHCCSLQSQIETDKYGTTELEPWHLIRLQHSVLHLHTLLIVA